MSKFSWILQITKHCEQALLHGGINISALHISIQSLMFMFIQNLVKHIILMICSPQVSTVLGASIPEQRAERGWVEGVAIWVAVLIITFVSSGNDYAKDLQFR